MPEADYEERLRKAVKAAGGLCLKLPAILYRGIPDRLVLLPMGRVFFIELKAEKGRVSKTQPVIRKFLQSIGFYSEIIVGKKGVEQFIREHVDAELSSPSRR